VKTFLTEQEFATRRKLVREKVAEQNVEALCLFTPTQVFYLSGFCFIPTERPVGLIYHVEKDTSTLFIPFLEGDHAEGRYVDDVRTYSEYPGETHPMEQFAELVSELGLKGKRIGVDSDGYGGGWGYVGPKLSSLVDAQIIPARDIITKAMWVKSSEEIELIRESVRWGNLAHALLQEYTAPGLVETDICMRASHEASMAVIKALGPGYRLTSRGSLPAQAMFRGQIGAQSALPHALPSNARIHVGDVLVTTASSEVGGYGSELERTMIVGEPTSKHRKYFRLMREAQGLALATIKPGIECAEVDKTVTQFFVENGIKHYWRHHTGHSLGFGSHESPFLDTGDHTVIEPGMVFSVEPGIFIPGFAGFRFSDTILVTENGIEKLTYYPGDIESLSILA